MKRSFFALNMNPVAGGKKRSKGIFSTIPISKRKDIFTNVTKQGPVVFGKNHPPQRKRPYSAHLSLQFASKGRTEILFSAYKRYNVKKGP